MLNPWLIIGTIAFVGSFGVSLLMTRDFGASLVAGSSALVTAFGTAAAVNWYRNQSSDRRMVSLRHQIRALQQHRAAEEQAIVDLSAEKERVSAALNTLQDTLRQRQLPSSSPYALPAVSWNLATPATDPPPAIAPPPVEVTTEFRPESLNQFIAEAAETKQKISASLHQLQSELSQVNAQVKEQRQVRDQLIQDVQHLKQQKQHLDSTAKTLTQEVAEIDRGRQELDQYVVFLESKKQELESGANPLQKALKQLQSQVSALQEELRSLEGQVTAKRHEKEALDQAIYQSAAQSPPQPHPDTVRHLERQKAQLEQELAQLQQEKEKAITLQQTVPHLEQQKSQLERDLTTLRQQQSSLQKTQTDLRQLETQKAQLERELSSLRQQQAQLKSTQDSLQKVEKQIRDRRQAKESLEKQITQLQAQKTALRNQAAANPIPPSQQLELQEPPRNGNHANPSPVLERPVSRSKPEPIAAEPWDEEPTDQELSDLWQDFMVQLPEYELQALKAIANESNPMRVLNGIAEENFTTPEDMINSINQLAEEMVGEVVIKPRGSAPPIIVKDLQRTMKKMIETYEYLTQ